MASTRQDPADSPTSAQGRRARLALGAELVVRRVFQLATVLLLLDTIRASSDLTVVWSARIPLLMVVAAAWLIGTLYLWFRSWWRLPPYWYVTPLVWSVVLLACRLDLPQTLRFRLLGERAFAAYIASNAVNSGTQEIDAKIGGYRIVGTGRTGDVIVFHAAPEIDWLADNTRCSALMHLEPADLETWRPAFDGLSFRHLHLSDGWWLLDFTTRGVSCQCVLRFRSETRLCRLMIPAAGDEAYSSGACCADATLGSGRGARGSTRSTRP